MVGMISAASQYSKMLSLGSFCLNWFIIGYHRPSGLNRKHLFLTVLEVGKSKAPTDFMSGENPLPGVDGSQQRKESCLVSFIRALISFMRALPF